MTIGLTGNKWRAKVPNRIQDIEYINKMADTPLGLSVSGNVS